MVTSLVTSHMGHVEGIKYVPSGEQTIEGEIGSLSEDMCSLGLQMPELLWYKWRQ